MQTVSLALEEFRRGGIVLLLDQANEGHLILAAECVTATAAEFMIANGTGGFQLATTAVERNWITADPNLPAFEIAIATKAWPMQLTEPVDMATEVARNSGTALHVLLRSLLPQDAPAFAVRHNLPTVTFEDLNRHRLRNEAELDLVAVADLPTPHSDRPFRVHSYRSQFDGIEHLALVSQGRAIGAPLVRIHSECLTGDAFGSLRCDCGPQLDESLRRLGASSGGILIYMRGHEGRGIGLANKMLAYALQDQGMDTIEANRALGFPADARDFAHAAQILRALGHETVRLLTNNPEKASSLQRHGITVNSVEPLVILPNAFNLRYLETKAEKFGHALPFKTTAAEHLSLSSNK